MIHYQIVTFRIIVCVLLVCCLPASGQTNQTIAEQNNESDFKTGWSLSATAGYLYQFDSDIDGDNGTFNVNRFTASASILNTIDRQNSFGFSFGYGLSDYTFSGSSGFAGSRPWSDIHTFGLSASLKKSLDNEWTLFAIPTLRFSAEKAKNFDDSLTGGGFLGASYKVSDTLTIGPGVGMMTQIEDDVFVFPVLLIDWKISDTLSLGTGRADGTTAGPGVFLYWHPEEQWVFSLGGRYEKLRFRLEDDNTVSPKGVGEDRSFPLVAGATYYFNHQTSLNVSAGVLLGGELKLEDENGATISDLDYDPAPFIGFTFRSKF